MENSRTQKSILNVSAVLIVQMINLIVGLVSRTFFVKLLGNEYLSVNGLFTNILTLLSFSELGIGNAIIFSLYKPISEGNTHKICALMNFYRTAYRIIMFVILFCGLMVVPFLGYIISDVPNISENIFLLYIFFLLNTVASYFCSYKKSLLIADQKNYVVVIIQQAFHILQAIAQIVYLICTHNYIGYLIITIICTIGINIVSTCIANKDYKFLKQGKKVVLDPDEKKDIFQNIKSIFLYKIGGVLLTGTDNILISVVVKTVMVGICSNYTLVINTINSVLMQACNSLSASIGSHTVGANNNNKEKKFKELNSMCYVIFAFSSICLAVLLNPLIDVWFGEEYILGQITVLALCGGFYVTGINQIASQYRTSMGIFHQAKFTPLIASVINIVLSVLLGRILGVFGIFLATIIARESTFSIIDPILVYKIGFNKSCINYFATCILRTIICCLIYLITFYITRQISLAGIAGLFLKTVVCALVSGFSIVAIMLTDRDFRDVVSLIFKGVVKKHG